MKKKTIILNVTSTILFILSIILTSTGFNIGEANYLSEFTTLRCTIKLVAYVVMGAASFLASIILFSTSLLISNKVLK